MSQVLNSTAWGPSLVQIFGKCLLDFEQFYTSQDQDQRFKKLIFRLHIEKCRFYILGGILGLTSDDTTSVNVEGFAIKHIRAILNTLSSLLTQNEWLSGSYGCRQVLTLPAHFQGASIEVACIASAFNGFKTYQDESITQHHSRTKWTISDCNKFADFLSDITNAVDGLQHVVKLLSPSLMLTDLMNKHIDTISDMGTLRLISEACTGIYPEIQETALRKFQASAMESAYRWRIEHWHQTGNRIQADDQDQSGGSQGQSFPYEESIASSPREHAVSTFDMDQEFTSNIATVSDNEAQNYRAAKPLVIPLDVMADLHEASMMPLAFQNAVENDEFLRGAEYPTGVVLDYSEDEDTKYASSDGSETVIDGQTTSRSGNTRRRKPEPREPHNVSRSRTNIYDSTSAESSVTNGFLNFDVIGTGESVQTSDYFVFSFALRQQGVLVQPTTRHDHSHLVDAQQVARIVRTDSYTAFDLKSWPRELQISELVNATSVDQIWMHAMRDSKFQANVFLIPTLKLPYCSSIDGCLRTLFDILAEQRMFAKCMPTISIINTLAPDMFVVPIGKETFVPRFISHVYPAFQPSHDVLLVLMIFTRQLESKINTNVGLWDIRRLLTT